MRPQRALIGVYTCSLIQWCTCSHRPERERPGLQSWALQIIRCPAQIVTSSEHDAVPQQPLQHGPTPSSSPLKEMLPAHEGAPISEGQGNLWLDAHCATYRHVPQGPIVTCRAGPGGESAMHGSLHAQEQRSTSGV